MACREAPHVGLGNCKINQPQMVGKAGRAGVAYRAELGLQLYLQALHGASQVCDLCLAGLDHLCVGGYLLVQLLRLQVTHKRSEPCGPPGRRGELQWGWEARPTLLKNHSSASWRLFSAMASYCSLISASARVRSTPGAASISTLTWPASWLLYSFSSCRTGGTHLEAEGRRELRVPHAHPGSAPNSLHDLRSPLCPPSLCFPLHMSRFGHIGPSGLWVSPLSRS